MTWIEVPNWPTYQHYKHRNPPWLRDYVRQLWHPEWSRLTLPQRGLLWTTRLAYAHHDGQLELSDLQSYVPKYERSHVPAIAERLSQAALLGFVASTPLSLKSITPLDARTLGDELRSGRLRPCPLCEVGGGRHSVDCPSLRLGVEPS